MTTSGTRFYVYEHWRLDRDECFYVGKGNGGRAYSSKSRNRHWKSIVAKLSRIGSAMEVRIVQSGMSEQDSFDLEIERIVFWKEVGADLCNQAAGGLGGSKPCSEEQKLKLSAANKGKKRSDETRSRMSTSFKGRVISEETRKKISEKLKGSPATFKGKKHSEETKSILSAYGKARGAPNLSAETIEKIAEFHRGRKRSPETCAKISQKAKGRPSSFKGKASPFKGTVKSEEFRKNLSEKKRQWWAMKKERENGHV